VKVNMSTNVKKHSQNI